jgi:uncharacterized protein (TIRG00374 family)
MTKKNRSTALQLVIFLGLAVALIVWRYNEMTEKDKSDMLNAFKHIRWIYLAPVFVIGFLSHLFRSLRWKQLLEPLSIFPSTANTLFSVLIGYLVNTLVPRLGEVAKCTVLAKYENVPADKLVGTIIAERAFDTVCLLAIIFITLGLQYDIIYPVANEIYHKMFFNAGGGFIWTRILMAVAVIVIGIIALILLYKKIKDSKVGHVIKGIGDGMKAIALVKNKWKFFLNTILIWCCYTASVVVSFLALPDTEHLPMLAGLSIISFGSIGMILTPGGIGAYPIIVAKVLLLYGITESIGLAYGSVSWAAQTLIVLILGLIALILLPIYNRTKHAQIEI